jgi:tetratricopeptide (TPR) repeat protein
VWSALLAVAGAAFCAVPLFDLLGYESSASLSILAGLGAGHIGVRVVGHARQFRRADGVGVLFLRAWALSEVILVAPLALLSLNALRVHNCDYLEGLAFFLLLPVVSAAYGAAAGVAFGLATGSPRGGVLAWLAWITGGLLLALHNVVFHPPVFAYHSLVGFVAGPIYDEEVRVTGTLIVARGHTLGLAAGFLAVAWALHDPYLQRLTPRAVFYGWPPRRVPGVLAILWLTVVGAVWANRGTLGVRPSRADIQRALGGRFETQHFTVYFEKGSRVERDILRIAEDHEFRYAQLREFFGFDAARKVRSYVYSSPEQKKRWMGAKHTSIGDPINREMHLNAEAYPHPSLKHELAHVLSGELRPFPKIPMQIGLLEGLAVAAEWDDGRLTPHEWSRAMDELGLLPSVEGLLSLSGFWRERSSQAYTAAGSFVRWLREVYGMAAVRDVYATGNFERSFGKAVPELVRAWQAYLGRIALPREAMAEARWRFGKRSIFEQACAHEIAALRERAWRAYGAGAYGHARAVFQQIAAFEPKNPEHRWNIVRVDLAAKRWAAASDGAQRLLSDRSADEYLRALAQEGLGDAEWNLGNVAAARQAYAAVQSARVSPPLSRAATIKGEALRGNAEAGEYVRQYFAGEGYGLGLFLLREATLRAPNWALGRYLLARALLAGEAWADAAQQFAEAERLGLPDSDFRMESALGRGKALYRLRRWDAAEGAFRLAAGHATLEGERAHARDWHVRCRWARTQALRALDKP